MELSRVSKNWVPRLWSDAEEGLLPEFNRAKLSLLTSGQPSPQQQKLSLVLAKVLETDLVSQNEKLNLTTDYYYSDDDLTDDQQKAKRTEWAILFGLYKDDEEDANIYSGLA